MSSVETRMETAIPARPAADQAMNALAASEAIQVALAGYLAAASAQARHLGGW